ncbi:natural resistance-associated macrophage protein [Aaosphaeria arxii CBS 175.79]|uniref:Natural resistance-associated macrophage protein n=1 Tax=Aaosphaeria arxii CBS 175.79 TaxID=1450172 RepID=A0A6A5Y5D5_9PLEO|nr:natural resistance-associated macrophage protein [Aaosphaeria arxii CBS 175.79]KAF2019754.1 natural resistance-associated macrophage protein [Aaosphaeria arxii CBS 175.79]
MNCPSRADPSDTEGWNQSPNTTLIADATTRAGLNHSQAAKLQRHHKIGPTDAIASSIEPTELHTIDGTDSTVKSKAFDGQGNDVIGKGKRSGTINGDAPGNPDRNSDSVIGTWRTSLRVLTRRASNMVVKYTKFIGPGFMVAVAYIDPGNYATDVAAGASFRFKLLFIVLMSNIFAIFLQSLCIKLGSVTGMNLAENCKANLPPWLNYVLYAFAESAIIATDIAEVIGTAIALNLLLDVPLVAGCAISIVDVLIILIFYRPSGTMRALRTFEIFVMLLVIGVVICFCFELSKIKAPVGDVFRGYLPSSTLVKSQALYQSCGILGATVMPHSLYLGSGVVQPRLREFDMINNTSRTLETDSVDDRIKYKPSLAAIQSCMLYSIVELAFTLFTFALFVNSSILIVAGASLYGLPQADNADLFSIHSLLSRSIAPVAGTLFALALLLSGTSAGIVCTISGQMVSEGQLNWSLKPWLRRLITRSISITPSIIIAGSVGREGLGKALQGSQVALSVILPFVSAPLIWFTCREKYMKVDILDENGPVGTGDEGERHVQMNNGWVMTIFALLIWGVIVVMNVALLVLVGLGVA